jgi:glycerophosphoryl diester phosphodiesterase
LHPALAALLAVPIAHRGLWGRGRPENSLAAAHAAVRAGYAVEADLQLSADGRAMVFHDERLGRLTPERGKLRKRSAAELGRIPLKGGSEPIPTLEALLEAVAGRVPLLLEVKDQDGAMGPSVGALEAATAEAVARYEGPVAWMSFNPYSVAELPESRPRGLVACSYARVEWPHLPQERRRWLRALGGVGPADFVSHDRRDLDRAAPLVGARPLLAWTVRSPKDEAKARRHARQITFEGFLPPLEAPAPGPT